MSAGKERISIKQVMKPNTTDPEALISWFCETFDLSGSTEKVEPEMLSEIVNASFKGNGVSSKELNKKLKTPRTTVIYHLNRFISCGLVVRKGTRYYLRSADMESTIEELRAEMLNEFRRMMKLAEALDAMFLDDFDGGEE